MSQIRPMKAPSKSLEEKDLAGLAYPMLISPKVDAVRSVGYDGGIRSKTLREFRNAWTNGFFTDARLHGLDGELVVGKPNGPGVLGRTMSGLTSADGWPDVHWYLFDDFSKPMLPYSHRFEGLAARRRALPAKLKDRTIILPHYWCNNRDDVLIWEQRFLADGYEGAMLRSLSALYKFGRATWNEASIYKFKRFEDAEARVVRFVEGEHNENVAGLKPDGSVKRATSKAGMKASGTVGSIIAVDLESGKEISVAAGAMTKLERVSAWEQRQSYVGRIFTYKHFPYGAIDAARHPTFKAWRDDGL